MVVLLGGRNVDIPDVALLDSFSVNLPIVSGLLHPLVQVLSDF